MYKIGARIYLKPLMPFGASNVDIEKILQRGKQSLLQRLKGKLLQQTLFSPRARAALSKAIQVEIKESSLQVISDHPGFLPLIKGQRRMQMKWLTKSRVPIPIMLETGELIFRNATKQSMANGSWWHPGRKPSNYIDKAKMLTREFMRDRMVKDLEEELRRQMRKSRTVTLRSR